MSTKLLEMQLSGDPSVPIYQQIKHAIIDKIDHGDWKPGNMIPSENQLVSELGASRMTINRSLRELATEGLVRRVHGLGTFVAEPTRQASLIELRSIADEVRSQGKTHRAEVLELNEVEADSLLAARMAVHPGYPLYRVVVLHYQDEVPIQLESRHVNPKLVPRFMTTDFTRITPTDYLVSQVHPDELEHVVKAIMPDDLIAAQLQIQVSEPCLKLKRRTWKTGVVVTAVDMIYPSSRYELGARYQPGKT